MRERSGETSGLKDIMAKFRNRILQIANEYREFVFILVLLAIIYSVASYFDLFESLHIFISQHEDWELDEIIGLAAISFFVIFAFFFYRSVMLKNEIKSRKNIEEELQTTIEKLGVTLESLPVAVYTRKAEGDFETTYVSDNITNLTGYAPRDFLSGSALWANNIHPDQKHKILSDFSQMIERGYQEHECLWRTADGSYKWFYDYSKLIKSANGSSDIIVGMWQDITEKKQMVGELSSRAYQNEIIAKLGQISLSTHDLPEFCFIAVNSASRGLGVECCKILKLLPNGEDFLLLAGVGWKDGSVGNAVIPGGDDSQAGYTVSLGQPVVVENMQTEKRFSGPPLLHDHNVVSGISTTIMCKGETFGVIGAHSKEQRKFTQSDVNFLETIANMVAQRIEQENAENEIRESLARLEKKSKYDSIISTITQNVHRTIELDDVLENAVESLSKNMALAEHISIFMIKGNEAVLTARRGLPDWFVERVEKIPYQEGFTWKVLTEGKLRYCPDVDQDEYIGAAGREVGIKSYLAVPFSYRGKTAGCISLYSFEKFTFSDDEISLLQIVAQQVETAIGNAKQAEALSESESRHRTIVENTYDLIVETDGRGVIWYANPQHKAIMGYEPEEMIGKNCMEYVHKDDLSRVVVSFQKGLHTDEATQAAIYRCKHKYDGWRWLESVGKTFTVLSGEARGIITSRDITERRQEEEERRESDDRFRALVEYSHDLIVEVDPVGTVLFANKNHKAQLGYDPEELIGKSVFEHIHPGDKSAVLDRMMRGLKNFSSAGIQIHRYKNKKGEWRWLESTGTPFKTSSGKVRAVIYSTDITERKKVEEELLKSQKLESLSILAGGIAHDFNNLLTIILGNVNLARTSEELDESLNKWLKEAEDAIQRATGLTHQLLTFSKGGVPNVQAMHINDLLKDSTKFALRGSNAEYDFSIADNLLQVEIDEGQINQVSIIFGRKYLDKKEEGGLIEVGAENITLEDENTLNLPEGEYVMISIKDSGSGISEEHAQKIFDPFFTTKEHGSGLGLATAFSIIKQHKGHITLDSRLNEGTTFTIYLPAFTKPAAEAAHKHNGLIRGEGSILIMDDDDSIREVLGEMVLRLGYIPQFAVNSSQAVKIYNDSMGNGDKLDAVMLDLTIPGDIGGKETLKKLLEIDPDIKAIVSSGYSKDGAITEYKKYGFRACIAKPYNINDLSHVLHDVITED